MVLRKGHHKGAFLIVVKKQITNQPITMKKKSSKELEYIPVQKSLPVSDLGCAAALVVSGFRLISFDRHNPQRVQFLFAREADIEKVVDDYFCDRLEVKARSLWDTAKALKSKLRSE